MRWLALPLLLSVVYVDVAWGQVSLFRMTGVQDDGYQWTVGGRDCTGDTVPDIVTQTPHTRPDPYTVLVLSGFDGRPRHLWQGMPGEVDFGRALALCDVTGDGLADILIGYPSGNDGLGVVYAYEGGTYRYLYTITGMSGHYLFGSGLCATGDLDGDGCEEFLVYWLGYRVNGNPNIGAVSVRSGRTGTELYRYEGTDSYKRFGQIMASLGDATGDGIDDFIIGEVNWVYGYSGGDGSLIWTHKGRGDPGYVQALGDVNGDAWADFVFTAQSYVRCVSGRDGSLIYEIAPKDAPYDEPYSLGGGDDLDGDGAGDFVLLAQADGTYGGASLWFGSGRDGRVWGPVRWPAPYESFNDSVDTIGDVTLDGLPDIVAGVRSPDVGYHLAWYQLDGLTVSKSATGRRALHFRSPGSPGKVVLPLFSGGQDEGFDIGYRWCPLDADPLFYSWFTRAPLMRLDGRGRLDLSIPGVWDPSWGTGLSAAIVILDPAYPFSVQSVSNAVRLR